MSQPRDTIRNFICYTDYIIVIMITTTRLPVSYRKQSAPWLLYGTLHAINQWRRPRDVIANQHNRQSDCPSLSVIFTSPVCLLCKNMTPSTKPEIHNVFHYRLMRTKPRRWATSAEDTVKFERLVIETSEQTDIQTHSSRYILPPP